MEKEYWNSIAHEYDELLGPLTKGRGVVNPIYDFVKQLKHQEYERVADFGCGTGNFLLFLAKYFKEVWGIDFSEKMLEIARKKCGAYPNIRLEGLDMRDLQKLYGMFDIAFTINSILTDDSAPSIILREIHRCLRPRGLLAGIFPSFEVVIELKNLIVENYISEGMSRSVAELIAYQEFVLPHKMDETKATYADDREHIQKFFYTDEIVRIIENIGFKVTCIDKVLYPWELYKEYGYAYFPGKPSMWDIFIVAIKT